MNGETKGGENKNERLGHVQIPELIWGVLTLSR
jgi:hypothetical protein